MSIPIDTFFLDPKFEGTLQQKIQRMISEGVLSGRFIPGAKLPSSRKLATHLGISRITVTLAYSELVSDDYLIAKGRSGYYVSPTAPQRTRFDAPKGVVTDAVDWNRAIGQRYTGQVLVEKPVDWRSYPYPFIYGQADERIFDHSNWRQCALQALGKREFSTVTADSYERDDPELVKYIALNTLPRRGIHAKPEQILITMGGQNALWLAAQVLLNQRRTAVMENPGYPGLRVALNLARCNVVNVPVDHAGMRLDALPDETDVVFTTPSHHCPTSVTMPLERRQELLEMASRKDFLIVEDDYEFEMSFLMRAHVAGVDAGHRDRLLHRVAAERLAQFLVEHHLDQRGLAALHLAGDGLPSAALRSARPWCAPDALQRRRPSAIFRRS
jgi:GntR family transcriptional regulator/MocR family aminotransferase